MRPFPTSLGMTFFFVVPLADSLGMTFLVYCAFGCFGRDDVPCLLFLWLGPGFCWDRGFVGGAGFCWEAAFWPRSWRLGSGGFQGDLGDLGGAVEADRETDRAQAAVDVELGLAVGEAEEAFDVL